MSATTRLFAEPADCRASYVVPRGTSFDVGGGMMLTAVLGVGVSAGVRLKF